MILKWLWRYRVEQDALWRKTIDAIHGSARRWEPIPFNKRFPGTWCKIVNFGTHFKAHGKNFIETVIGRIGNGKSVRFWLDPWFEDGTLKTFFPDLFRLERDKFCLVEDRFELVGQRRMVRWSWRSYPSSMDEGNQLINLHRKIADTYLVEENDKWSWVFVADSLFFVKEVRRWIQGNMENQVLEVFKWSKWIPSKCNMFMWRVFLDRIPTLSALRKRNINVGNGLCILCGEVEETTDHLFSACRFITGVWLGIASWCKIAPLFFFSAKDVLSVTDFTAISGSKKEVVYGILILACWHV
ncbi:putative reverse transcriptase zinc-binding domain-containing protein [Helianthus annuus]|nr:putative reverse transcriptase zinc-binding domain-containing protein [Helianthus annuus]KAJ0835364.1 putative reverse transcriptase zinc-binding domain-containing protein [Helianthus annuus]